MLNRTWLIMKMGSGGVSLSLRDTGCKEIPPYKFEQIIYCLFFLWMSILYLFSLQIPQYSSSTHILLWSFSFLFRRNKINQKKTSTFTYPHISPLNSICPINFAFSQIITDSSIESQFQCLAVWEPHSSVLACSWPSSLLTFTLYWIFQMANTLFFLISLNKQTNLTHFFLPIGVDVTNGLQFLFSHSFLSPHYSGFCLHFYSLEFLISASPMSSVSSGQPSFLVLLELETVWHRDYLFSSLDYPQVGFWTPCSLGFSPTSLVASLFSLSLDSCPSLPQGLRGVLP